MFRCLVCQAFSTDSLELLLYHCSMGRSLPEAEWKEVTGDTHRCKLCCYGTQLKANFQLHLKTDKHAQKYQLAAHLREGGGAVGTPVPAPLGDGAPYGSIPPLHLRCNICDFESNSKEKMQLHARGATHEENSQVYKVRRLVYQVRGQVCQVSGSIYVLGERGRCTRWGQLQVRGDRCASEGAGYQVSVAGRSIT